MDDPVRYAEAHVDRFRDELFEFLAIPSVSARPEHSDDMGRAAEWLASQLRSAGLDSEVIPTPRHPIVLGEWRGAGPDSPTVVVYGHYDVQPPEPLDEWTSPPFEPEIRNGRIYARGAADDKGQLFLHVKALEALLGTGGELSVNVVVLAEGEEEIGSPDLIPFVKENSDRLAADAVVISDTEMFAPGVPTLLFSLRGLAYFEIRVRGPAGDLHSGTYGGAVTNPAGALALILGSLWDDDGRIAVPGFYDDVVELDEDTRRRIDDLAFDPEELRREVGVPALGGEKGYSALERLWLRPSCDINGLLSGYTGEGAKTVLPSKAEGKVSFRLVPDQDPARVGTLFREHVRSIAPPGVEVEIDQLYGGRPWRSAPEGPFFEAAVRALKRAFGTEPVLTGAGGSIPIVVEFEEILEAPCLLMGFALPGANMHAPDEWFPVENLGKGIEALVRFYEEIERGREG